MDADIYHTHTQGHADTLAFTPDTPRLVHAKLGMYTDRQQSLPSADSEQLGALALAQRPAVQPVHLKHVKTDVPGRGQDSHLQSKECLQEDLPISALSCCSVCSDIDSTGSVAWSSHETCTRQGSGLKI